MLPPLVNATVELEPYWSGLFAKALEGINVKEVITNFGSGVSAAPPTSVALSTKDKKKKSKLKESGDDINLDIFD